MAAKVLNGYEDWRDSSATELSLRNRDHVLHCHDCC